MRAKSVSAVILSSDKKKVLLIKRRDVPVWVLPGGGVEKNESEKEAILREIKEETGFSCSIIKKVAEYTPINKLAKFTFLFECKILSGEKKISSETKDIDFFEIEKLPKLTPPPYENWIKDTLNNSFLIKRKITEVTYFQFIKILFLLPILVFRFVLSKIGLTINS